MVKKTSDAPAATISARLEGMLRAVSPISHGSGDKTGTGSNTLWRIIATKIVDPDNSCFNWVPVYNGSAFRGLLRDRLATIIARRLGGFRELNDYRFFFSGGSPKTMEKGVDAGNIVAESAFRAANPVASLLGGQMGSIMAGNLKVGRALPYLELTRHLIPAYFEQDLGITPLPGNALETRERAMLTRRDDAIDPRYEIYLRNEAMQERDEELTEQQRQYDAKKNKAKAPQGDLQQNTNEDTGQANVRMIVNFEAIPMGIHLYHWMHLVNGTRLELGALMAALRAFSDEPYIGGRSASGYGEIDFRYALIVKGRPVEQDAVTYTRTEGFALNSDLLSECETEFSGWLEALDYDHAMPFSARK